MAKDPDIDGLRGLMKARAPDPNAPPPTREQSRAATDEWGLSVPMPEDCEREAVNANGVSAEKLTPGGAATDRAILYFHGGGYVGGSVRSHRHYVARLAEAAGCWALSIDYRLAPEHPFPAAVEDALAAYRWLLEQGVKAEQIAIAGDSAGGGLTLALVHALKGHGLKSPACLYPISPWADLTQSGAAYQAVGARDPMITKTGLDESARHYHGEADPKHSHISPAFGDFDGFPPMLIHVGSEEMLLSDSLMVAERAALAGVEVRLEVWPEMIHVWPVFHPYLSAGRRAIAEAGAWIAAHTGAAVTTAA